MRSVVSDRRRILVVAQFPRELVWIEVGRLCHDSAERFRIGRSAEHPELTGVADGVRGIRWIRITVDNASNTLHE